MPDQFRQIRALGDDVAERVAGAMDAARAVQPVPVNVYETDGALVVVAPLPGVMPDDVEVTVEDQWVHISAEMRTPAPKDYLLHEWHYGPYQRTVEVPQGFGGDASATFGNGQLAIRVLRGGVRADRVVLRPTG